MKEIVRWLPLIVILATLFSLGTFFIVKLLKKVEKQRKAISIFAIIAIIGGCYGVWGSLSVYLVSSFILKETLDLIQVGASIKNILLFRLTMAVILLTAGIGVLKLKNWGRVTIIIRALISLSYSVYLLSITLPTILGGKYALIQTRTFLNLLISLLFNGIILWFFNQTSIKAQFKHSLHNLE